MQNAFVQSSDLPDCFGLSMENWNEKFEQNFANEIEVRLLAYSTFPATQVTAVGSLVYLGCLVDTTFDFFAVNIRSLRS